MFVSAYPQMTTFTLEFNSYYFYCSLKTTHQYHIHDLTLAFPVHKGVMSTECPLQSYFLPSILYFPNAGDTYVKYLMKSESTQDWC